MSTSDLAERPLSLLFLLFIGYTSLSFARRALQDVFTAELTIPGDRLDATQLGIILSSQTLGYTTTKLVSGIFMDQLNPSAVFVYTLWSTAGSLFFMALSSNRYCWFIMYTINGLALGVGWPAVAKILRTSVAPNELATWWGVLSAAVNVAGGLGPWLTMSIMSIAVVWLGSDAWRSTFIIIGLCCLLCGNIFAFHLFGFQLPRLRNQFLRKNVADSIRLRSDGPRHGEATGENTRVHRRTIAQNSQANELQADATSESLGNDVVTDVYRGDKQHQSDNILLRFQTLCNTLSPTYRLLLCASAALHMSSTFLRFAICNWFPVMFRQYQDLYSIHTSESSIRIVYLIIRYDWGVNDNLTATKMLLTVGKMSRLLERQFIDRKVRGSNPTSACRLPLSRFGQPVSASFWCILHVFIVFLLSLVILSVISLSIANLFVSVFELGGIFGNLLAGLLSDMGVTRVSPLLPFDYYLFEAVFGFVGVIGKRLSAGYAIFRTELHMQNEPTCLTHFEVVRTLELFFFIYIDGRFVLVFQKPSRFLNPRIPYILGHMAIACAVLCGLGLSIAAGIPWGILMISALLLGLSVFGAVSLCGVLAVELVPVSLSGTSHALTALCANVGAFAACYPISRLSDVMGWANAFVFSGICSSLALLPMCLLHCYRFRKLLVR
ncbi:hypothetical protein T265_00688 [Opisthorchis viverrini]|uniref:Major facilitator superfamily (MFS) profile domain-containing protein n=3 Tax=Opisthorchis viverrini TaxID=6198 RepID=A0A075ABX5_OPIVI|nr:hypothetical protein T265_00688 [Opisthorchis viverrini]KER33365.1 hypothetical protein T265_00688 [Opisthorchis viverrini]